MTEPTSDRPLVTFALFAYNQEEFIRDAVQAALSQTYTPLEIILSDDFSPDTTFSIMQEMAAAYDGPHRVIARRNPLNMGTAMHVQAVANEMLGEFMVVAAGDDISRNDRVERLIDAWDEDGRKAVVLHSWTQELYEGEHNPRDIVKFKADEELNLSWHLKTHKGAILAPTAAYRKSLFEDFAPLIGGSLIEDGPMIARGFLSGSFLGVPEPLVVQRKLSVSLGAGYRISDPVRWNSFVRSKMISQLTKLQDVQRLESRPELHRYESIILKRIKNLSRCLVQNKQVGSFGYRYYMALQLFLHYPGRYSFRGKLAFCLRFCEIFEVRFVQ